MFEDVINLQYGAGLTLETAKKAAQKLSFKNWGRYYYITADSNNKTFTMSRHFLKGRKPSIYFIEGAEFQY